MKVSELITQLSVFNPDAEVSTWCMFDDGELCSDVTMATIHGIADFPSENKQLIDTVHINISLGINSADLKQPEELEQIIAEAKGKEHLTIPGQYKGTLELDRDGKYYFISVQTKERRLLGDATKIIV